MRIAFTGSHSTGKTTLLEAVRETKKLKDIAIITEVVRNFQKNYNIKLNEQSDSFSQLLICNEYLKILLTNDHFLSDRSMIDCLVYTTWLYRNTQSNIPDFVIRYQEALLNEYMKLYDHIFYTPIEFPLVEDGVRSSKSEYRDQIDSICKEVIEEFKIPITILTGTVEERLNTFFETIKV